jgi:hypothetical protein
MGGISMKTKLLVAMAAAALLALAAGTPNQAIAAEDCPRGALDEQYCDRDGNLTADTPTDAANLVDPDTIIFAYTPVEDPAVYREAWADFLTHMEQVTLRPAARRRLQHRLQSLGRQLRRLRALHHHGRPGRQLRL